MEELASLMSEKQKAFCDYYIETANATEAARRAGYSEKTAKSIGSENLTKPNLKEYIELRLKELEDGRVACHRGAAISHQGNERRGKGCI